MAAAVVALAAVLALPGLAQARPAPSSVGRTIDVGPDGATLTLACPGGAVALAGAVSAISPEVTTRASVPRGITEWRFSFAGGPGRARAVVRCVRVRPSANFRTSLIRVASRTFGGTVTPDRSLRATLRCPAGYTPTGYGFEQGDSGTATVTAARPGSRAWSFVLENEGSGDTRPTLHTRCLSRSATATRPGASASQPLIVRVAGWRDRVRGASRRRITHRCPAGHFSAGAGHSLPAGDDIVATRAFAFRSRPGRWLFTNPGGRAVTARSYLTCLSLRTDFR
jgi:hypothetical protein